MLPIAMSITLTEESLASGQLEFIGKMISKLSPSEFVNTVKYIELWEGNAFRNAKPELNLVRVFDSKYNDILIEASNPTKRIKNSVVLLKGKETGDELIDFGWEHIKQNHLNLDYQPTKSKFVRTIDGNPVLFSEDEVLDIIKKTIAEGFPAESNVQSNSVYELAIEASDNVKGVRVVIGGDGQLITAIPLKTKPVR